jgi:hypothetical protein
MRKLLAGGFALGLASAGSAVLAVPTGAQQNPGLPEPQFPEYEVDISPDPASAGDTVTVTPVTPCTLNPGTEEPGTLLWFADWFTDDGNGEEIGTGEVSLDADGNWVVTFEAPAVTAHGEFFAFCLPTGIEDEADACIPDEDPEDLGILHEDGDEPPPTTSSIPEGPPFDCLFESYFGEFEIVGGPTPTTPPGQQPTRPPAPANPIVTEPPHTG